MVSIVWAQDGDAQLSLQTLRELVNRSCSSECRMEAANDHCTDNRRAQYQADTKLKLCDQRSSKGSLKSFAAHDENCEGIGKDGRARSWLGRRGIGPRPELSRYNVYFPGCAVPGHGARSGQRAHRLQHLEAAVTGIDDR
jgi:hypothetical protein